MPSRVLLALEQPGLDSIAALRSTVLLVVIMVVMVVLTGRLARLIRSALGDLGVGEVSVLVNVVRAVLVFLVVYLVGENLFGLELGGIVQTLGITTLVVSLGLQDLIRNVVAGIQIVTSGLFSVGDQIEVGAIRGEVLDISWRRTTLRDKDGDPIVIPNATIMGGQFLRRVGTMSRRYDILLDIKPGLDLERVAEDIQRLADEVLDERGWRAEEHCEVRFLGSTANGVSASVRIYLKDIELTTHGYDAVMRAICQRGYLADWTNENPAQAQWR